MRAPDLGDRLHQRVAVGEHLGHPRGALASAPAGCARSRCTRRRAPPSPSRPAAASSTRALEGRTSGSASPLSLGSACDRLRGARRGARRRRRRPSAAPAPRSRPPGRAAPPAGAPGRPRCCGSRRRARWAEATASWDFSVKRSGCIGAPSVPRSAWLTAQVPARAAAAPEAAPIGPRVPQILAPDSGAAEREGVAGVGGDPRDARRCAAPRGRRGRRGRARRVRCHARRPAWQAPCPRRPSAESRGPEGWLGAPTARRRRSRSARRRSPGRARGRSGRGLRRARSPRPVPSLRGRSTGIRTDSDRVPACSRRRRRGRSRCAASAHPLHLLGHPPLQLLARRAHPLQLGAHLLDPLLHLEHGLDAGEVEPLLARSSAGSGAAARRRAGSRGGCSSASASGRSGPAPRTSAASADASRRARRRPRS